MFNPIDYEVMINERRDQLEHTTRYGWQYPTQHSKKSLSFKLFRRTKRSQDLQECYGA